MEKPRSSSALLGSVEKFAVRLETGSFRALFDELGCVAAFAPLRKGSVVLGKRPAALRQCGYARPPC